MVALTGLSRDTLRWYEKQGLLPPGGRGADGRRRYLDRNVTRVPQVALSIHDPDQPYRYLEVRGWS